MGNGLRWLYPQITMSMEKNRKDYEPVDFGLFFVQTRSEKPIFPMYIQQWDLELMAMQLECIGMYWVYAMRI